MAGRLSSCVLKSFFSIPSRSTCLASVRNFSQLSALSQCTPSSLLSRSSRTFSKMQYSTDVALRDFLKEEIEAEKAVAQKHLGSGSQTAPTVSGFQIKADEAEVVLTKTFNNEKITISFNVNDCVRPQDEAESQSMDKFDQQQEQDGKENSNFSILAEPAFRVEVEKKNQKLIFECEFVPDYQSEEQLPQEPQMPDEREENSDLFNITSVYLTTGEITDKLYGASGEILDGTLYDHLFDYLAERGIDNKFADDLIRFATHYEHAQYVNLLQKLKEFVSQ